VLAAREGRKRVDRRSAEGADVGPDVADFADSGWVNRWQADNADLALDLADLVDYGSAG